jgi:hypothetical protein
MDSYVDVVRSTGKEATQKITQSRTADAATWDHLRRLSTSVWAIRDRAPSLWLSRRDSEEVIIHEAENRDNRETEN